MAVIVFKLEVMFGAVAAIEEMLAECEEQRLVHWRTIRRVECG